MSIWAAIRSRSSGAGLLTGLVWCQTQQNGFPGCSGSPHSLFKLKLVDTSRPGRNAGDVAEHTGSPTGILLGSSSRNILVHKRRSPLPDLKRSPVNWRQGHRPNHKITCKIAAKIQIPDACVLSSEKNVGPASHGGQSLLLLKERRQCAPGLGSCEHLMEIRQASRSHFPVVTHHCLFPLRKSLV